MPIPATEDPKDTRRFWGKYDLTWFVLSGSPNKAIVKDVLEFFCEPENYQLWVDMAGVIPVRKTAASKDPIFKYVQETGVATAFERYHRPKDGISELGGNANASFLVPVGTYEDPKVMLQEAAALWKSK
jgi:ABC-type glycerol-3-phosphate transport system substrate-binding protein